jgi:CubicO group peptidase (beta-lactamase class C family)
MTPMAFPLAATSPDRSDLDRAALDRLSETITRHLAEGRYPGAQIALARHGRLALVRTFGDARTDPARVPARDDTLWLLYSNTKVVTACALWLLVERGALRFTDRVAEHLPGFEANGKGEITVLQLLTHQGGFPSADVPRAAWEDHDLLRRAVCGFSLEWTPGSQVVYHSRAAHWTAAALIEQLTKTDYRGFIRDQIVEPLGLGGELFVGVPDGAQERTVDMHEPSPDGARPVRRADENTADFRRAGTPGGGGYATARAMAAFYQMLLQGGTLNGVRLLSPRMVEYVTRNHTGDRVDGYMGMPMHRGLGPHVRGLTPTIRGLGSLAHPRTFGHGGVGSSYCWGDPDSGVSFAYLTNSRLADPWHVQRLDAVSNLVHAAIDFPSSRARG